MFDVYDNPIFDGTPLPQLSQTVFEYIEAGIRAEPKEKETITWVEIRITTPITNWEIDQIHINMGNDLKKVEVVLIHYKPDWS